MQSARPAVSQPQPFLQRLREATARSHEALHHNAMLRPMAEGCVTVGEYRKLMLRFLGYYRTLDPILISAGSALADRSAGLSYEPRSPFFERDLCALGTDLLTVTECTEQPAIATWPAFAGALYVIEGSSLGGSTLERAAARSVRPEARSYWIWCRENCGDRWRMTRQALTHLETTEAKNEAIEAAEATFDTMLNWFENGLNGSRVPCD